MKVIAITNQKGGVGKTTSTVNTGAALALHKKRVLIIDLDPQAGMTKSLGIKVGPDNKTIYDVLVGEGTLQETIIEREEHFFVVPATQTLAAAEIKLANTAGREFILREALENLNGFEYILIDCPPSLGFLTLNALTAAHEVLIPLQTGYLALDGVASLKEIVETVQKRLNQSLRITGVLGTQFDKRNRVDGQILQMANDHFGKVFFNTRIRQNVSLKEAPSFGKTIFEYKPSSNGADDYFVLAEEIIQRGDCHA